MIQDFYPVKRVRLYEAPTCASVNFRPRMLVGQKHHRPNIYVSWTFRRIPSDASKSIKGSQIRLPASIVHCEPSMGFNDILHGTLAIINELTLALQGERRNVLNHNNLVLARAYYHHSLPASYIQG